MAIWISQAAKQLQGPWAQTLDLIKQSSSCHLGGMLSSLRESVKFLWLVCKTLIFQSLHFLDYSTGRKNPMPNYINICFSSCDVMVIYSDARKKMHPFLTKQGINRAVNLLNEACHSFLLLYVSEKSSAQLGSCGLNKNYRPNRPCLDYPYSH